jgi:hypothetical protein
MIAKLMTEAPTHLRVLRSTVPPEIDAAVMKALAKTPADRFTSAGDFSRALAVHHTTQPTVATPVPASRRSRVPLVLGLAAAALVAAVGVYATRAKPVLHASLGAKTQLTSTGAVFYPAISPDGKQLAFMTRHCTGSICSYATVVQDVGGTTTRTILDSATSGFGLEWSPDRRNLIFAGTVHGRIGAYLLSALGGEPRWLTSGVATFYAGGDSLLLGPSFHRDSIYWVRVAALDGVPRDSIRIAGPGNALAALSVVPGTSWILSLVVQAPHGLWQIVDRSGKVADHVVNACTCGGIAATDAVWLARAGDGLEESVVRIAIDRSNGHFAARQDTMTHGVFTSFSLTSDGARMAMDEGTFDHGVWALPLADALTGTFPDARRVLRASANVAGVISPDGSRLLVRRLLATGESHAEPRYSIMPYEGGAETPFPAGGNIRRANWSDSQHVATAVLGEGGLRFAEVDVQSGAQRNTLQLSDSVVADFAALPNGWVWIPAKRDRIVVSEGGRRREFAPAKSLATAFSLAVDPATRRVFYAGYSRAADDSIGVGVLTLDDGKSALWTMQRAEDARVYAASGHPVVFAVANTQDSWSLLGVDGPNAVTPLGTVGAPIIGGSLSRDLTRATFMQMDYRADAWLNQVVVR